ncbi:hypothetical protein N0V93_005198 [Gnomoniopsis smithogilvyi]|uniref:Peroxisomal adenine nucleotide transporter 1 n=1 Tax=Gnomoniopsis smithogilvyi TaxID=1191159 RepID=A0A9W9CXU7_9PEZI|nr:hypothetical protein N0V93_005198 [Gnomoniopsis smithogilvyi]
MPADKFLPAIGHAVSGATGTAISTTITYPLDLVNTRLKVQRQFYQDGAISPSEQYSGLADAFSKIFEREGGLRAFYAGLGSDVAKSVADSFLFFLFYTWFRTRRSQGNSRRLPVWEELAVGAAAGACARLFTTPISNVVTRKQTAFLVTDDSASGGSGRGSQSPTDLSFGEVLHVIRAEKGFTGLWAGYGATLVLTLNPSITFYLQHALKKALMDRGRKGESGGMVFLIAALSKVIATTVTYPFNIAKVRAQVSAPESPTPEPEKGSEISLRRRLRRLAQRSIFGALVRTGQTEGIRALYDGISGEILKAFFNHGTTMLSKDIAHGFIVRLYFLILELVQRSPTAQALLLRLGGGNSSGQLGDQVSGKYGEMKDGIMRGAVVVSIMEWTRRRIMVTK